MQALSGRGAHLVDILKEIEHTAAAPRLRAARVMTVLAVLVREFWNTGPRVLLNVLAHGENSAVEMMKCLRWVLW